MSERLYEYIPIQDLKDMLEQSGKRYGDNIAYKIRIKKDIYQCFTHREVRQMINALGTALIDIGLKGKKIAIIGENRYEWEIAYLAIACGVGVVVPLDKALPENELKELIKRSGVEAIFYSQNHASVLEKMRYEGVRKFTTLNIHGFRRTQRRNLF